MKPLAISAPKRLTLHPNVPTLREAGFPDIGPAAWFGILAPRGTPQACSTRSAAMWRACRRGGLPAQGPGDQGKRDQAGLKGPDPRAPMAHRPEADKVRKMLPSLRAMMGMAQYQFEAT